jgi:hypothetical protein
VALNEEVVMMGSLRFGLGVLVALFALAAMPAVAAVEAGQALAVTGEVTATQPSGEPRALRVGDAVFSGDLIRTAFDAAVQIRYTDGALVSLAGNTQYRIDEYAYAPGARGFFSLLKGALRTLTGLLGKTDRAEYRVTTPMAVIGVRGTDYQLRLCQSDCPPGYQNGLYLSVFEGAIAAVNEVGEYVIQAGESAFIPDARSPLKRLQDPSIGMGDLQPWRGAGGGGGAAPALIDANAATDVLLEFRATDLIRCNR